MTQALAAHLNALPEPQARATLTRCCGAPRWVERMLAARPFTGDAAVHTTAEWTWWGLSRDEWLQAFAAHLRIGERPREEWADREQAGMRTAAQATRRALEVGNRAYEERFGHVFLICASGRSAAEMLGELRRRLTNDPAEEVRVAAGEQAKIIRLRLERLVEP
jgi:OHCU decarboxylase